MQIDFERKPSCRNFWRDLLSRNPRPLQLSASDHARSKKASLDCALDLPDPVSNLGERRCSDVDQWTAATSCVDPNSAFPSEKPVVFLDCVSDLKLLVEVLPKAKETTVDCGF